MIGYVLQYSVVRLRLQQFLSHCGVVGQYDGVRGCSVGRYLDCMYSIVGRSLSLAIISSLHFNLDA